MELVVDSFWPLAVAGLSGTIPLALASFAIGLVLALGVALMRHLGEPDRIGHRTLLHLCDPRYATSGPAVRDLLRPAFARASSSDPWPSAILAFSLNVGGYAAEIIRAAILSVPKGQWEAAHTIGHVAHGRRWRRIILPQAARVSVPPLSNTFISLVKDTSLASLILVTELFRQAQMIAAFSL